MTKEIKERVLNHVKSCGLSNCKMVAEELGYDRVTVSKAIAEGLSEKEIKVDYRQGKFVKYVEYVNEGSFTIKEITSVENGEWGELIVKGTSYESIPKETSFEVVERKFKLSINKSSIEKILQVANSEVPFF